MADEVDLANQHAEMNLALAIAAVKTNSLIACGSCYYCDSNLASGLLFCDALCRDDYDYEERLRKQQGHA